MRGIRTRGLTLLELLIVLLLMGLLTALAVPRLDAQLAGMKQRALTRTLRDAVESLPLASFQAGRAQSVDAQALRKMLGEDWPAEGRIELDRTLDYGAQGVASGGMLTVTEPGGARFVWEVEPVTGRLVPHGSAQGMLR